MTQTSLTDLGVSWRGIPMEDANWYLNAWGHKMGIIKRVDFGDQAAHGLLHDGQLVAVACTDGLIRETVGKVPWLTRETCVELSRLCAVRPGLCRVALRLWREFTWPDFKREWAVSYQDANLHNGDTYRFDGWKRVAFNRSHGVDPRTGRRARDTYVWVWPPPPADQEEA